MLTSSHILTREEAKSRLDQSKHNQEFSRAERAAKVEARSLCTSDSVCVCVCVYVYVSVCVCVYRADVYVYVYVYRTKPAIY